MAFYAKLTEDNRVLSVLRFDEEDENTAVQSLTEITNWPLWKKADITNQVRAIYPTVGYHYDSVNDIFHEPQPYPSWTLNISTGKYEAPTAKPQSDNVEWNESTLSWDIITQ